MQSILVTGGAGFIGSHTCLLLLEKGYEIVILDSLVNSSRLAIERIKKIVNLQFPKMIKNLSFVKGDLRNEKLISDIFDNQTLIGKPIAGVIHLAGLKSIYESMQDPLKYWEFNLISTINLLKIMKLKNCKTIVFSSSAAVYGLNQEQLITEDQILKPINPYGLTKLSVEKLLMNLYESEPNEWRIINLRYFNPVGAHKSGLIGEDPLGFPNNIFPLIMQTAAGKIKSFEIYGSDWPTIDGTGVRDYIHVMDLANGHLLALEYLISNSSNILNLNLGTGVGSSVLQLIKTFERVNKIKVPFHFGERRAGDVPILVAENSLSQKLLNWKPEKSLDEMCKDGWNYQKQNFN